MALTRWEPTGMRTLRDQINRMFEDVMGSTVSSLNALTMPPVDVFVKGNDVVVEAELPGLEIRDVEVSATEDTITLRGTTQLEREEKDENYFRSERRMGTVNRTVQLPATIDPENTKASFKNGVLTIRAPLVKSPQARKVQIESERST